MGMVPEDVKSPTLVTERQMVGPATSDDEKGQTKGDRALRNAIIVVLVAWAVLIVLVWSLRQYNV